jgi:hypothetical protein
VPKDKLLDTFYNTFRGNDSFFVKHQAPFQEDESGKIKSPWINFAKYNQHNPPPEGKAVGDLIPVTRDLYRKHLNGGDGLAIAPITNTKDKRNVCFYAAIDIDDYTTNFTSLVQRLSLDGFMFASFLSKSGGLHIYFFFTNPEPAAKVVETLEKIVAVYGLAKIFKKGETSKVEIFPKQATFVPGEKNAGCLFLPFYNATHPEECKTKMITAEGKLVGIAKALPLIKDAFMSLKAVNAVIDGLPYSDAPYCIQAILLSGVLGANDGRNKFLFCAAIYLKKKYKDNFKEYLQEMNNRLETPLDQKEIDSTYTSVTTHGYDNYSCKYPPCADYCDRKLCALREYGIGKQKGGHFTGADCWGEISVVTAKKPYYLWKVRVNPEDEFKDVRIDDIKSLHNQATVQELCWECLHWAPFRVKDNDWVGTVNTAMEGIENRKIPVPKGMDTTEMGELYSLFIRYLAHARIRNGHPALIHAGQVYYADGAYYFSTGGIMDSLRFKKFSLRGVNLREELLSYGCQENSPVTYKTAKGEEKTIACWQKPDDAELEEACASYEDVYAADAENMRKTTPDEDQEDEEGSGGSDEGVKF